MRLDITACQKRRRRAIVASFVLCALFSFSFTWCPLIAQAGEAQWIWSPAYKKNNAPVGVCYFRKTFHMGIPESGQVGIVCDDSYELYVNGRKVGTGENWKLMNVHNITRYLVKGRNTIAVKATNLRKGTAGLAARVTVKSKGNTYVSHSTDATWRTSLKKSPYWQMSRYNDVQWVKASSYGVLGQTLPWGDEVKIAGNSTRFKVARGFRIEWVIQPKKTGSLVAMTFNEFGEIIASREEGPLLLVRDTNGDDVPDAVSVYCDKVKNCQGILALNGQVFVTGDGPDGAAFYRLSDEDRDGKIDHVKTLFQFTGPMGEHGPHAAILGPDGLIYIVVGNHSHPKPKPQSTSPHHHFYEGVLNRPKYEDPGGHAVGMKVPGGTIIRTDSDGSFVEVYAGGLRNAYDLAFNQQGDLFTYDSDMEWDRGMPWYRPTRMLHVTPGAEFGWRSGWSKWPEYYLDSLRATLDTGPGSPTGVEIYNHYKYPQRFRNAVFLCDWSRGRILVAKLKPQRGTYSAVKEVFVEGRPLNITDMATGPDGWLYFSTGGRDTEGGIYRIVYTGKVATNGHPNSKGISTAILQPQLHSAWGRQQIAMIQQDLGKQWDREVVAVVKQPKNKSEYRVRALDLMQLFGPSPTPELLVKLSEETDVQIRIKATYLMGIHSDESTGKRLVLLLDDSNPTVRRKACESLARAGQQAPVEKLLVLLASSDRNVAWAARRSLEQMPQKKWQSAVLESPNKRVFLVGAVGLLVMKPEKEICLKVLDRCSQMLKSDLADDDFIDLLRVIQLSLYRGELTSADVNDLRRQLVSEYPSKDHVINRELIRLLVYLQDSSVTGQLIEQLVNENVPSKEKLHIGMHVRFLRSGWKTSQKLKILKFYEYARTIEGGYSLAQYIDNVSQDFFAGLTAVERELILADAKQWPSSALTVLAGLPEHLGQETISQLKQLDRELEGINTLPVKRLRIGILAVLGRSRDPDAMAYLRKTFQQNPNRRITVAMALAQLPAGENWPLLVQSLTILEGVAAQEVLIKLAQVDRKPEKPESIRQAILCGLRLGENGGSNALPLLKKWTGKQVHQPEQSIDESLAAWQSWFAKKYPDQPEAKLPTDEGRNKWTLKELLSYLSTQEGSKGNPSRGALVFTKSQCIKCHRHGNRGESIGPDLTTISRRFHKKEILESILFPSHVISDQYQSSMILTTDGRMINGITAPGGDGTLVILQSNGEKVTLVQDKIKRTLPSKISAMPEGLLNSLTLEEIADLFAFLNDAPAARVSSRRKGLQHKK